MSFLCSGSSTYPAQPNCPYFTSLTIIPTIRTLIGFDSQSDRLSAWEKGNILPFSLTMLGARIEPSGPLRFHLFSPLIVTVLAFAGESGTSGCFVQDQNFALSKLWFKVWTKAMWYFYVFTLLVSQWQNTVSLPDQSQKLRTLLPEGSLCSRNRRPE